MANINNKNDKIDDIVSMIDSFMAGNGGHINVSIDSSDTIESSKNIRKTNSLECAAGNLACQVPTLHEGLDDGDNESDN